jgi:nitrogen fixation NifU-like protein
MTVETIYREYILHHFQHPTKRGKLEQPTVREQGSNPLCGDDITVDIIIDSRGRIENCRFQGQGCAISQAAADILCTEVVGKEFDTVMEMNREDMLELLGIELGPVREQCGLLAYNTVKTGLIKYSRENKGKEIVDQT